MLNQKEQFAHNLWGVDAAKYDPNRNTSTTTNSQEPNDDESYNVVTLKRREQYIHVKLETKSDLINITEKLEEFLRQLRRGDPNIHILPYNNIAIKNSEIIEHEKSLPKEKDEMAVYIDNIKTENSKLLFSIRIATIDIDKVKTIVYAYCKQTGSWTDFVAFKSRKIFAAGFFYQLSPFYHNRDDLEQYIYQQAPNIQGKLTIYRKEIFHWDDDRKKFKAQAIVLDGAIESKDEILSFLYEHQWQGRYQDVVFVPYKTNESFNPRAFINMIIKQDEYIKSLDRVIINVNEPQVERTVGNTKCTFQSWLYNATISDRRLITGVETAPKNLLRVLCEKNDRYEVERAMHQLYEQTVATFGQEIADTMLDKAALRKIKSAHGVEMQHSKKLIALSGNPQGPSDSSISSNKSRKNAHAYYGTYLEVSKTGVTQASEITNVSETSEIEQMRSTLNSLVQKQSDMEASLPSMINNSIDTKLDPLKSEISQIRNETNTKLNSIESSVTNLANTQKSSISEAMKEVMQEYFKNKAPSDATRSPGVEK